MLASKAEDVRGPYTSSFETRVMKEASRRLGSRVAQAYGIRLSVVLLGKYKKIAKSTQVLIKYMCYLVLHRLCAQLG